MWTCPNVTHTGGKVNIFCTWNDAQASVTADSGRASHGFVSDSPPDNSIAVVGWYTNVDGDGPWLGGLWFEDAMYMGGYHSLDCNFIYTTTGRSHWIARRYGTRIMIIQTLDFRERIPPLTIHRCCSSSQLTKLSSILSSIPLKGSQFTIRQLSEGGSNGSRPTGIRPGTLGGMEKLRMVQRACRTDWFLNF